MTNTGRKRGPVRKPIEERRVEKVAAAVRTDELQQIESVAKESQVLVPDLLRLVQYLTPDDVRELEKRAQPGSNRQPLGSKPNGHSRRGARAAHVSSLLRPARPVVTDRSQAENGRARQVA